ncbi:hypothetical protein SEA_CAFASSO_142 [Gordonia phage Cafasso]|uniref:Uncharacterized protein n=1 Tax=Gordonia phage Cafasso TaxID=2851095 RepID=A0AAE7SF32_9CAUD|nr:hypothetical protein SEA_CAFASSO_142 [Gordonia phage Cafasso]
MSDQLTVVIYHNRSRDNFRGYQDDHRLVRVFDYQTKLRSPEAICEHAFMVFNAPEETLEIDDFLLAVGYRERELRSLSVGDVVVIGETAWACDRIGWKHVRLTAEQVTP